MPTMIKQQRCYHGVRIIVAPAVVVVRSYAGRNPKTENNHERQRASSSDNPIVELVRHLVLSSRTHLEGAVGEHDRRGDRGGNRPGGTEAGPNGPVNGERDRHQAILSGTCGGVSTLDPNDE
jgi:hypothetical protein